MTATRLARTAALRHAESLARYSNTRSFTSLTRAACISTAGTRPGCRSSPSRRQDGRCFSTTRPSQLRDFFPAKDTPHIQTTPPAWPHPGYTMDEMVAVTPGHRAPETLGDKVAWRIVRFARYWMDKATGMERSQDVDKKNPTTAVVAEKPLTEAQWVSSFLISMLLLLRL